MEDILKIGRRKHVFLNWAHTYGCKPELYFEPRNLQELRQILAAARVHNKKVKVIGNGHSPSDIGCTDDYMISIKHFDKVLDVNHDTKIVKVEGGILLSKLISELHENNLALSVLGSISDISLAGAISTGTHGSGLNYGALGSYVLEMDLLCADGTVLTLSRDSDEDLFLAGCLNLGALGIILSLKLQCETTYRLESTQYELSFKDLCEHFDMHSRASQHFRCLWFPHTEKCQAVHVNRTEKAVSTSDSWFWNHFIGYTVLQFLYWISSFVPPIVPWINRIYFRLLYSHRHVTIDRYNNIFNFDCLFRQYVMEWAIPIDRTTAVLCELKSWIEGNFYAHFPVEIRCVKGDDFLLSPAYKRDSTYINVIMYRPYNKSIPHETYWLAYKDIMIKNGGRAHWAKDSGVTRTQIESMYPRWNTFLNIQKRLDPTRMFINNHLQKLF